MKSFIFPWQISSHWHQQEAVSDKENLSLGAPGWGREPCTSVWGQDSSAVISWKLFMSSHLGCSYADGIYEKVWHERLSRLVNTGVMDARDRVNLITEPGGRRIPARGWKRRSKWTGELDLMWKPKIIMYAESTLISKLHKAKHNRGNYYPPAKFLSGRSAIT